MITYAKVVASLKRAVAAKGEGYVYEAPGGPGEDCYYDNANFDPGYYPPGESGCIVGWVARDLFGTDVDFIEGNSAEEQPWAADLEKKAVDLLKNVQFLQDGGSAWGNAVAMGISTTATGIKGV